jgi:hypothetical protein
MDADGHGMGTTAGGPLRSAHAKLAGVTQFAATASQPLGRASGGVRLHDADDATPWLLRVGKAPA